jgi:EmrB/QacA subfamily drug resistance transporter
MSTSELTDRQRWTALVVLCVGMLMIVLDTTVVNVALPSIQNDLGFTNSGLAWVVNAYLIAFGGLLLLAGRLGDLISRRRVFLVGLGIFTVASLLCGLASSQDVLVAARFVQGAGGALVSAGILGMIVTMSPDPREQAKAIGIYAFVAAGGGSIGLLLGGVLTQALDWHWIFFVNVPIGIAAVAATLRLIDRDEGIGMRRGADLPGSVLITGALMLAVYTIVQPAAADGWGATTTLICGAGSLALLALFVVREMRASSPLVPLRVLRSRTIAGADLVQALSGAGMFGTFFLGSLFMQRVLGYDALEIGLSFLPTTAIMAVLSLRYADRLAMRFGARSTSIAGLGLIVVGLVLFTRVPVDADYVADLLPVMVLLGLGGGICFPAQMNMAMSTATPSDAGLASGLVNTAGQVGGALSLAVLATVSASRTASLAHQGVASASALTGGYHLAFALAAGFVAAAILIAIVVVPRRETAAAAPGEGAMGASTAAGA